MLGVVVSPVGAATPARPLQHALCSQKTLSHGIAVIEECALESVLVHKPLVCDYLIIEPVVPQDFIRPDLVLVNNVASLGISC